MLAVRALSLFQPSKLITATRKKIPHLNRLSKSRLFASNNDNDSSSKELKDGSNGGGGDDDSKKKKKKEGSGLFGFKWVDLLEPDPDNLFAVGLTGLLTWASVQVLWQLFFISGAIVVAALKYSFIAALLLFILIALL